MRAMFVSAGAVLCLAICGGCSRTGYGGDVLVPSEVLECTSDTDCPNGTCANNLCEDCSMNSECASGTCVNRQCVGTVPTGGTCDDTADCQNGICENARCTTITDVLKVDGETCANEMECNSNFCDGTCFTPKSNGDTCTENDRCMSGACIESTCSAVSGPGGSCDADDNDDCLAGLTCELGQCITPCEERPEACDDTIDNNCNGEINEGCAIESCLAPGRNADAFANSSLGRTWRTFAPATGSIEETAEGLVLSPPTTFGNSEIETSQVSSMRDSSATIDLIEVPDQTTNAFFAFYINSNEGGQMRFRIQDGALLAGSWDGLFSQQHGSVVYDSLEHRYLRIRHGGSTVHWEASADNIDYTEITSITYGPSFDPEFVFMEFFAAQVVTPYSSTPGRAVITGFNPGESTNSNGDLHGCPITTFNQTFDNVNPKSYDEFIVGDASAIVGDGTEGHQLTLELAEANARVEFSSLRSFDLSGGVITVDISSDLSQTTGPETFAGLRLWVNDGSFVSFGQRAGELRMLAFDGSSSYFPAAGNVSYNPAIHQIFEVDATDPLSLKFRAKAKDAIEFIEVGTISIPDTFPLQQMAIVLVLDGQNNAPTDALSTMIVNEVTGR